MIPNRTLSIEELLSCYYSLDKNLSDERIHLAESLSKKRVASSCFLKMVAGHAEERGASNVFLTASALVGLEPCRRWTSLKKWQGS